jgi:tripartite-type tricarboxylate transporter receptor subunit TctC
MCAITAELVQGERKVDIGLMVAKNGGEPTGVMLQFVESGQMPGGVQDLLARKVGAEWTKRLGRKVVVENHAGANGAIATHLIARSPADGYVIGIGTPGTRAVMRVTGRDRP